jgi:predicted Zn finger-like uncharacterized protein
MILTCPSCSTRYLVDPAAIGPEGRSVRCARCGHTWRQAPEASAKPGPSASPAQAAAPAAAAEDDPRPILRGAQRARPLPPGSNLPALRQPPRRRAGAAAWLSLIVVVGAGLAALFIFRQQFVAIWPPAAKLYRIAGLAAEAPGLGLDIRDVRFERQAEAGQPVLLVTGQVVNVSASPKPTPRLRVAIGDEARKELVHWTVPLARDELGPGEAMGFSTRLPNPPANARSLSVTFLPEG